MKTLILDNYDSFTHNLYQLIGELDEAPVVVRNDRLDLDGVRQLAPERIVISPGPGSPEDPAYFGVCSAVIAALGSRIPILGVCLGHQGIAAAFGARIVRAPQPMHGKSSAIEHRGDPLFAGVPSPFEAMRYHSLVVDPASVPAELEVIARTPDGVVMGVRHRRHPIAGVQFHPESVGTPAGRRILANFLGARVSSRA